MKGAINKAMTSLSLRRAWIEITKNGANMSDIMSLSLRRAWIEIHSTMKTISAPSVALLTESVD